MWGTPTMEPSLLGWHTVAAAAIAFLLVASSTQNFTEYAGEALCNGPAVLQQVSLEHCFSIPGNFVVFGRLLPCSG